MTEAEQRAALLATAQAELREKEELSAESQRQVEVLNQQVAELRAQVGTLQTLLDVAEDADAEAQVQIEELGQNLNTALARVAAEERRRAELEEAERIRLSEEAARLQAEAADLETYRSEFFGNMRRLLEGREGIQVVGDRFVFSSEVLFDPGSAQLSPEGQAQISRVAGLLREISADVPPGIDWVIQVDGHTDDIPINSAGPFDDNWELSQARALSVVRQMSEIEGIPAARLSANGYGEFQPIDPAGTPEARARNRRIEIKLTER
jgi:chemotaxis protein MotB